ncbi:hypothetical protein I5907_14760 [Panacibacter sp. DH6]|uniref:Uncharacterized protein n=1 Tax=Panacibacter microcysteis TaxID=2793269 RepID=A0A931GX73_9BACT|nr:hypothetical protein [Panacibacter microcysteis]MBG9377503.1 hypothetical protein [Panacibacter microcysteis]
MKKITLLLLLLPACITLSAQQDKAFVIPRNNQQDSVFKKTYPQKQFIDSLPSAYFRKHRAPLPGSMPNKMTYLGNNGKGFDIYQTPQDNMFILRPDSSFYSNMPVKDFMRIQSPASDMPNPLKERKN